MNAGGAAAWDCPNCTLINRGDAAQCAACDRPRNTAGVVAWTCNRCTFAQEGGEQCAMCRNPRPGYGIGAHLPGLGGDEEEARQQPSELRSHYEFDLPRRLPWRCS